MYFCNTPSPFFTNVTTLLFQDRDAAFDNVSRLYLQYVKIYRTLNSCYDLMVHPQKRQLLRKLLDSTIGRIIELKVSICYELIYIQKY